MVQLYKIGTLPHHQYSKEYHTYHLDLTSLMYNCDHYLFPSVYSWILTRSQAGLSPAATGVIENIVSNHKDLFEDYYQDVDQTKDGCSHSGVLAA